MLVHPHYANATASRLSSPTHRSLPRTCSVVDWQFKHHKNCRQISSLFALPQDSCGRWPRGGAPRWQQLVGVCLEKPGAQSEEIALGAGELVIGIPGPAQLSRSPDPDLLGTADWDRRGCPCTPGSSEPSGPRNKKNVNRDAGYFARKPVHGPVDVLILHSHEGAPWIGSQTGEDEMWNHWALVILWIRHC